jgi:hypothetical protein
MLEADRVHSTQPLNAPAILTKVASEVGDLEEKLRLAHNLAYAARMLATSEEMDRGSGAALNSLAGVLSCTRFRRHRVRCFMEQEVRHGEKAVYAGVQA